MEGVIMNWMYLSSYIARVEANPANKMSLKAEFDNVTQTLSTSGVLLNVVTNSAEHTISNFEWYFTEFASITDYLLAWVMNLGGNVANFIVIVNGIIEA